MALFKKSLLFHIALILVVFAFITEEVDGRRKILRGRKTVTREYHQDPALPAWAIILLVGIAELVFGGIFYIILKRKIVDPPLVGTYAPANTNLN